MEIGKANLTKEVLVKDLQETSKEDWGNNQVVHLGVKVLLVASKVVSNNLVDHLEASKVDQASNNLVDLSGVKVLLAASNNLVGHLGVKVILVASKVVLVSSNLVDHLVASKVVLDSNNLVGLLGVKVDMGSKVKAKTLMDRIN